ncbi:MAG: hypothetical protein ACYC36_02355 [Bellilinea sp.]
MAYSGNSSAATLQQITASAGTAITGAAGSSAATLQTISATGTAVQTENGSMLKTAQYATKSMTGFWQAPKTAQRAIKSMSGFSGVVATMSKRGQIPAHIMETWPIGAMVKTARWGIKTAQAVTGSIGSTVKIAQYGIAAKTGYFAITAVSAKIARYPIKSMTAAPVVGSTFSTFAMHTEWQGLSQYTNYPFNSFAQFNGMYLGASSGGLFVLSGATDDGVNIDAVARVGVTDFGTSRLKKVEYAYVGYRTTGDCVLRMITNDAQTRDYRMPTTGETGLHVKRVKLGKGVIARYYQFEIRNLNGADFDLNTLEIKPTIQTRRVQGGRA